MRSETTRFGVLAIIVGAASLLVSSSKKEAWQWTLEERIANRTNPAMARERVGSDKRIQTQSSPNLAIIVDRFNGKTHPELFLPHEVFEIFVSMAFEGNPRSSQGRRDALTRELRSRGFAPDFWDRLRSITTIYIADTQALQDLGLTMRQQNVPGRRRTESALELKQMDLCRSRAEALAEAREQLGGEKFDRFLYEVIAVSMFHAGDSISDPESLRRVAGGCR